MGGGEEEGAKQVYLQLQVHILFSYFQFDLLHGPIKVGRGATLCYFRCYVPELQYKTVNYVICNFSMIVGSTNFDLANVKVCSAT